MFKKIFVLSVIVLFSSNFLFASEYMSKVHKELKKIDDKIEKYKKEKNDKKVEEYLIIRECVSKATSNKEIKSCKGKYKD